MALLAGIGERLKAERERLGYSQERLATVMGIARRTVINYETECNPVLLNYIHLLGQLGANEYWLLFGRHSEADAAPLRPLLLETAMAWAKEICIDPDGRPLPDHEVAQFVAEMYEYLVAAEAEGLGLPDKTDRERLFKVRA